MKNDFQRRLRKLIGILLLGFVILFVFRLIYGYTLPVNQTPQQTRFFDSISNLRKNYASELYEVAPRSKLDRLSTPTKVDQKYEKVAEISTKSTSFDEEEQEARQKIQQYKALIQFEQKSGNQGYRNLNLVIGVPPEHFDSLYHRLVEIGQVQAKQITKKDKTNEYKELNAKKASLEKIRRSLIDLKSKGGKIEEYMRLENRILEIEQQLQELGVSLGDFDDENEFCTVRFSLREGKVVKISLLQRVKVALEWTVKFYLRMMAALFFVALFAYLILLIIGRLKVIERMVGRQE